MAFEQLGKYKIVERIGRGAMGEVFKAYDPALGREVAVKTISASLGNDHDLRQRFHREAQAAARLNHPNIITVYEYGEEQGTIYMAMELLEGADLKNMIGEEDLLPSLDDKLDIMEQICDGLAFAHSREIIHRDIKPGNIHVQPNGQVKILDFGLARLGTSEMTRTGTVMGTPHYMSPEQVLGDKVELSSDVFSVGAVFYELLCNHKPFDGDSAHAVLFQVVNKQPEPVRKWRPDLPPILVEVVEKALSKDRKQRFQNAAELREALALARRAIRDGRPGSTLAVESAGGLGAPRSASDSFRSLPPKSRPPSAPGRAEAGSGIGGARPAPPSPSAPSASGSRPPATQGPGSSPPVATRIETRPPARSGAPASRPPSLRPAPARGGSRLPLLLGGGLVAVLAILVAVALFVINRRPAAPAPEPSASEGQVGVLTEALASTQLELARRDLDDKDYRSAIAQADRALKLQPDNAEALQVKESAEAALHQLDEAAALAKSEFDAGHMDAASEALGRVLAMDPNHPVATELSANLNSYFRSQAEEARGAAARARSEAEKAQAGSTDVFARAAGAVTQAEGLLAKGEYAVATQGFLDARDSFDRARRAVEAQARETARAAEAARRPGPPVPRAQAQATPAPPPPSTAAPTPAEPVRPVALPPRRSFVAGQTMVRNASAKKGPAGFDTEDVTVNPDFLCRIHFEPSPAAVRVGESYRVRVFLVNEGEKALKIRDVTLTTVVSGVRSVQQVTPPAREVPGGQVALLNEVGGAFEERTQSWSLEAAVTSPKGDVCRNQVEWK